MQNDVQVYIELLKKLTTTSKSLELMIEDIKKYQILISKGLIINEKIMFENDINLMMELLIKKNNKIKNELIPMVKNSMILEQ